jgi:hypothetical protein
MDQLTGMLGVPPKVAWQMIGCGPTKFWELVKNREIETYKIDRATRAYVPSIKAYVERQLERARAA